MPALIAHGSGWDEALVVLVPLLLIGVIGYLTSRRRQRSEPSDRAED